MLVVTATRLLVGGILLPGEIHPKLTLLHTRTYILRSIQVLIVIIIWRNFLSGSLLGIAISLYNNFVACLFRGLCEVLDTASGRDQVPPERNKGGFPDDQQARLILYFRLSPNVVFLVQALFSVDGSVFVDSGVCINSRGLMLAFSTVAVSLPIQLR